ncbi:MAG TPA: class I SAM-dependent methyltransferase [Candidatus Acidoferrales bacterium]|nr:class I SAM-dependent methyltransferase [Candidatus Acidoferrales bacterium]
MARPSIDFGQAADDYARHRPGFPVRFYERVLEYGVGASGQAVLDIGCGTGTLARGFAERSCRVVGLDPSPEMLHQAQALAREEGFSVDYVRSWAEHLPFRDASFDVICAGQCWHWFDRPRAAAEVFRLLRPGGVAMLAYFTYLSDPGTIGQISEEVLLRFNPTWPAAGSEGRFPFFVDDLTGAGLTQVDVFEFVVDVPLSHAAWVGRMRACNGVILMSPENAAAFDSELSELLRQRFADPLSIPHRIYTILARRL